MTDELKPGQLRHMARLFGLPITITVDGENPQTFYPTAHLADLFNAEADVREKATRRKAEAGVDAAVDQLAEEHEENLREQFR